MHNPKIKPLLRILEKTHRPTMLELLQDYTPFQLLIITMLSARTKDSTTIPLVKEMFKKYPSPKNFVNLELSQIEKMIYPIGFYRIKARHLKKLSTVILENYSGNVPPTFKELVSLPGIGRKTANCILNYVFNLPAIAVDIHVHRISNRLGLVKTKTPEQTEEQLKIIVPKEEWVNINKLLVGHGQNICLPVKPNCWSCGIRSYCKSGMNSYGMNSDDLDSIKGNRDK